MPKFSLSQPINTFVIRVWREWSLDKSVLRGNVEHLESEKRIGFNNLEQMLRFFHATGLFVEDPRGDFGSEPEL
jgi:hypothetical protein